MAYRKLNFDFTLDISRAQQELGYTPIVTLDEGIERTAYWLKDHGKLHHWSPSERCRFDL